MKSMLSGNAFLLLAFASTCIISCNNDDTNKTTTTDSSTIVTDTSNRDRSDTAVSTAMVGHAQATLSGTKPDTTVSGTVNFDTTSGGKVKMNLELSVPVLAGKEVAVHLHEHGDCGDMGQMAHAHWNPNNTQHGKWGSASYHAGDIGNVKLDSKGNGKLSIETNLWSIGGAANMNVVGKSVIVHSGKDDYKTQPSGNSGSRIGCGVIQ